MQNKFLYLKQIELGPMQNFVYILGDPRSNEAAVIDPGWEAKEIISIAQRDGYHLTKAIVTHHHFDHVMGLAQLLKSVDLPVYVHRNDAPMLNNIERSSLRAISEGEVITVGDVSITAIHTPGHTPGSMCLLAGNLLLSGDTLFVKACGRWDLPGGNPVELYESLTKKLKVLDDATILCPGHNYADNPTSTIGREKQLNPFLQPPTLDKFLSLIGRG